MSEGKITHQNLNGEFFSVAREFCDCLCLINTLRKRQQKVVSSHYNTKWVCSLR